MSKLKIEGQTISTLPAEVEPDVRDTGLEAQREDDRAAAQEYAVKVGVAEQQQYESTRFGGSEEMLKMHEEIQAMRQMISSLSTAGVPTKPLPTMKPITELTQSERGRALHKELRDHGYYTYNANIPNNIYAVRPTVPFLEDLNAAEDAVLRNAIVSSESTPHGATAIASLRAQAHAFIVHEQSSIETIEVEMAAKHGIPLSNAFYVAHAAARD